MTPPRCVLEVGVRLQLRAAEVGFWSLFLGAPVNPVRSVLNITPGSPVSDRKVQTSISTKMVMARRSSGDSKAEGSDDSMHFVLSLVTANTDSTNCVLPDDLFSSRAFL